MRWRRWARRVLGALAALVALAIALVLVVLYNLDHPWVKARVLARVAESAGVEIDYGAVRLRLFRGVEIHDLVVRSAPAVRNLAPELARVGKVEAAWSTALFTGSGRRVDAVTLSDVALTIAIDEEGKTSFDFSKPEPTPAPPTPPEPPTPLSRRPAELVATARELPSVDVRDLSVVLVRKLPAGDERTSLRGLALRATPRSEGLHAEIGAPDAPRDLELARGSDEARAKAWIVADVSREDASIAADVEIAHQSFVDSGVKKLLHAEAAAHFDPAAQKTTITVANTTVGGDVASATASIELSDQGSPLVRKSEGSIDFVRLLEIVPASLLPFRASVGQGRAAFRIRDLGIEALPRLGRGAEVAIDLDVADLRVDDASITKAKASLHVEPAEGGGLRGQGSLDADEARVGTAATVRGLSLSLDATQDDAGGMSGRVSATCASVAAPRLVARDATVGITASDLFVDPKAPLSTKGDITVTAKASSIDVRAGATRAVADGLDVRAHSRPTGDGPLAVDATAGAALVRAFDGDGRVLARAPVRIEATATEVVVDEGDPAASRGKAHVVLDAADVHVVADGTKAQAALDYRIEAKAATLSALRPLLPPEIVAQVALDKMAVALRSEGRADGLRSEAPSLRQHTELHVERPSYGPAAAREIALTLDAKGSAIRHEASGDLRAQGFAWNGSEPTDDRAVFAVAFDRAAPSLRVEIDASGHAQSKMKASFGFDRARRAVTYDVTANAARLSPLAAFVQGGRKPSLDLSELEIDLSARGALLGVVSAVERSGAVRFEAAPRRTGGLDGTLALTARHVRWANGANVLSTPMLSADATFRTSGERRTVDTKLEVDELDFASGPHVLDVVGIHDRIQATLEGDVSDPQLAITQQIAVQAVKQNVLPTYPVGDTKLAVAARRGRGGTIHISKLEMENGAGGTSLALEGALDPGDIRGRLSLRGKLRQDLARLSNAPERFSGRGIADVGLRVESPDLSIFRTIADVRVDDADVRLPASGIRVEGADGEIPISIAVHVGPRGVEMLRDADNPYSSLRFADQHPLLSRSSFISVRRVTLPQLTIAPLVGNLQIQQNIFSLRQFEMGVRGGRVTGQCALDWNGEKSVLDMHVRADGVQSSHGEPFTGSAALVVSFAEHSIDGRADIRQIGSRHLLDLLDFQDPLHADPAINKVRSALKFGYPDKVRVTFNHGFASVNVSLGGLARLFSVDELRGIPIGPLVDRFVPLVVPSKEAQ